MEYRIIFNYDGGHWTAITGSDKPEDIIKYINSNIAEMQEAIDDAEDNSFCIKKYNNGDLVGEWYGSPEELLEVMKNQ